MQLKSYCSTSGPSGRDERIRTISLDSSSAAEDAALCSLADACEIGLTENLRVIGGQMVSIYRALYPQVDLPTRATSDTDAALESEVAASGKIHTLLEAAGYKPVTGNSYRLGNRQIDLLTGNYVGKFKRVLLGGRAFDSAPGVQLALDSEPLSVKLRVRLISGDTFSLVAPIPPLDIAVSLKALSYNSRLALKDLVDLYHLLLIANHELETGGEHWRLADRARADRLKAQQALHKLADNLLFAPTAPSTEVDAVKLSALIRRLVFNPGR